MRRPCLGGGGGWRINRHSPAVTEGRIMNVGVSRAALLLLRSTRQETNGKLEEEWWMRWRSIIIERRGKRTKRESPKKQIQC